MYFFKVFLLGIVTLFKIFLLFIKYFFFGIYNIITIFPKYFILGIITIFSKKKKGRSFSPTHSP